MCRATYMLYITCSYSTIFFIRHFFSTTKASTSTFLCRRSSFQRNCQTSITKQFPQMTDGTVRSYTHTNSFINFGQVINCSHDLFRCRFGEARKIRGLYLTFLAATHFQTHCLLREINTVNVAYDRCQDFIFFNLESTLGDEYLILIIRISFLLDINYYLRYEFHVSTGHHLRSTSSFVLYKYSYRPVG